jgi:hypothetical protein
VGFFITNVVNSALYDVNTGVAQASFSKLDSIVLDVDAKMTEVYTGQGAYPVVNILADRKPKIMLKGPEFSLGAAYRMLGATNTPASSTAMQVPAIEDYIIPAGGAVPLLKTQSTVDTVISVIGIIDDAAFAKVASAPTALQYSVATAGAVTTVTFNAADVGKTVRIFYSYDSSVGGQMDVSASAIPGIYTFKAVGKVLQNINDPAKTAYDVAIVIKSMQMIGNMAFSFERQKAGANSLDISILDPGPGFVPISIRPTAKYA